jgi:uncharacterized protein YqgC (DUF456 family)
MPTYNILLWALSAGLMAIGVAGAVLPVLPGAALVLAGALLGAWIDDFERVGAWTITILVILAVLSWVLDYVGVLVFPFLGAAAGEYLARRDHRGAARVGVATGLGLLLAMVAKVVIAFVMVGVFVVALIV